MIRVLLADDQEMILDGLAAILREEPDFDVVGLARNGREAVELARATTPDVAILDVRMPVLDGIEAARSIVAEHAATRVLMLTTFDVDQHVYDAVNAGASGFLLKDAPRGRLARAVRDVSAGEMPLDPVVTRRLVDRFSLGRSAKGDPGFAALSERELAVLREVAKGHSNAEIAQEMFLSAATVKTHVANILRKLGERDRIHLVIRAYESGLVEPTPER